MRCLKVPRKHAKNGKNPSKFEVLAQRASRKIIFTKTFSIDA